MQTCPYCREEVLDDALKCKHCHEWLQQEPLEHIKTGDYMSINNLREARAAFEKDFITNKLDENKWNVSKTAEIIGLERSNLHRKMKDLNIAPPK